MAVTRSRVKTEPKSGVRISGLTETISKKEEYKVSKPRKRPPQQVAHQSTQQLPKIKEEEVNLVLRRSLALNKQQEIKEKERTHDLIMSKLRPGFQIKRELMINKRKALVRLLGEVGYRRRNNENEVNSELQASLNECHLPSIKEIVSHHNNLQVIDSKGNLAEVKQYEIEQNQMANLPLERQQLMETYWKLFSKTKPTTAELVSDIKKLPNFNKRSSTRKKNRIFETGGQQPSSVSNTQQQYPLSILKTYKNMNMKLVSKLKQEQLLDTCRIYNLRLKNLEVERTRFDLDSIQIVEQEIYPMDDIYLRTEQDSDDEGELPEAITNWRDFVTQGLKEEDYLGEREFKENEKIEFA